VPALLTSSPLQLFRPPIAAEPRMPTVRSLQRGFTLIELMIAVALIGVLVSIAIPNFIVWQAKSRRSEAMSNIASIARSQQAFQAEKNYYVDTGASLPAAVAPGTVRKNWDKTDPIAQAFALIGWEPDGQVFYQYGSFSGDFTCAGVCELCFTAQARGDTDGDNVSGGVLYVHRDELGVTCADPVTGWSSALDTSGVPMFEGTGPRDHTEF
jgi:prepilin-type N-terminal cleavage/methylation domain-containing protein